jgi:hypothetical protein
LAAAGFQGVLWLAVIAFSATNAPLLRAHAKPTDVTYLKDVAPILQKRCVSCHADAGSAFPLDNYDRARHWARSIRESVLDRRMPPWPAAPGFGDYRNDRSLTPIEIELLTAWTDGRTPLGAGDPLVNAQDASAAASRDAISVALPPGHPRRASIEAIEVSLPLRERRSITEWEFHPAAPGAITRAVFFVNDTRLGAWVPSQGRETFPDGVAVDTPAGSRLRMELHYAKSKMDSIDGGRMALRFGAPGEAPGHLSLACGEHRLDRGVRALSVTPFARGAGDAVEIVARYPDGAVVPLSVVPRYLPAYPFTYEFRTPVTLPRGTVVGVHASAPGCRAELDVVSVTPGRVTRVERPER